MPFYEIFDRLPGSIPREKRSGSSAGVVGALPGRSLRRPAPRGRGLGPQSRAHRLYFQGPFFLPSPDLRREGKRDHFNNFGGLVLFSLPPKRFFRALSSAWHSEDSSVHYPLRMGLARRRWCVYWPPKVARTGSIFRGCESEPKKPSPRHENSKRNTF